MKRIISIWILLLCAGISKVQAQNDATLAGMILVYTNKAEKELKNQEKVMLMQTTGHVWTKEEVEGTTDLRSARLSAMRLRFTVFTMKYRSLQTTWATSPNN